MTLYLKYRPQTIEDLDLTSVRETLKNIVNSGKLPHAFLFAGPRGAGKTSAARILAKVINCKENKDKLDEPCNKCAQCISIAKGQNMDVIELDAASNRRIDDIRALKENIALAPNSANKKVYIIDEAHMLTKEASNAFLKTLEEPPGHVIFILATTDPQMLPATILSRVTKIQFTKATDQEVKNQLKKVIKGEGLKVEDGVENIIASVSDGSFRDAVKALEALSSQSSNITKELAENFLTKGKSSSPQELLDLIATGNTQKSLELVENLAQEGGNIKTFIDSLLNILHEALLADCGVPEMKKLTGYTRSEIIDITSQLIEARAKTSISPLAELPLQIVIASWKINSIANPKITPPKKEVTAAELTTDQEKPPQPKVKLEDSGVDQDIWTKSLMAVRGKNTTVDALLRAAKPLNFDGKVLTIGVYYRFHKERLEVVQNKLAFEQIVTEIVGSPVRVDYALTDRPEGPSIKKDPPLTRTEDNDIIQAAKEIFGN